MKKELSVIIPTRPNIDNIVAVLSCLRQQTFQNFQVFLIIDSKLSKSEHQELQYSIKKSLQKFSENKDSHELDIKIISNINYDFEPRKNASATRNYGIKLVNTPYLYLFDDDNIFADDHLDKTFRLYTEFNKKFNEDFVVTSTLMYRKTGNIQNQGFKKYNYWMSRPKINFLKNKKRDTIRMYSGNGLFGPSHIFQETLYDETLDFVAEDLDFTYRITKKYPMIVHRDLKVYHMERKKTYLEHARVGNPFGAYRKAKHRIIFAKKHANTWEKIQFYTVGLWGNSVWLVAKILIFGGKQRWEILKSFWKGTWDGLRENIILK